ncbi:cytidine/deoxycytidylate deaminase family protein [Candidatus Woesearchaeota archaeon]|nr:cytidine/deoxycytidylate deaminase family protein [Candidatus Woesearchaeota archaeon]
MGDEKRPSWDDYFLDIMVKVGSRATCDRGKSGCVITKNNQILVTGYVGSPVGMPHCDESGHQMRKVLSEDGSISDHCMRTTHAEQNAICQAAKLGIALDGATLYSSMTPCYTCAKMIVNCGIKRVICLNDYHSSADSKKLFKDAGTIFEMRKEEVLKY